MSSNEMIHQTSRDLSVVPFRIVLWSDHWEWIDWRRGGVHGHWQEASTKGGSVSQGRGGKWQVGEPRGARIAWVWRGQCWQSWSWDKVQQYELPQKLGVEGNESSIVNHGALERKTKVSGQTVGDWKLKQETLRKSPYWKRLVKWIMGQKEEEMRTYPSCARRYGPN